MKILSKDFNQNISKAKHASLSGPVFIMDSGEITHVLLSFEEYLTITDEQENIVDLLAMPEADAIEFEQESNKNQSA